MRDIKHKLIGNKAFLLLAALFLFIAFFVSLPAKDAGATNPGFISFQGKVVNADGTNVTNGSYNFDFVLYDDLSLGTPSDGVHDKWHELTKSVTVTNGIFQTNLGSATALPDFNANPSLYLAVRFNADAAGYMSPRVQLGSVPYALNADKVGGVSASNIVQLGASQSGNIDIGSGTLTSGNINGQTISSSANFTGTLTVQGASVTVGTASQAGSLVLFDNDTGSDTVTLLGGAISASYSLILPTAAGGTSQCLQTDSVTASQLVFSACSAGGGDNISINGSASTDANFIDTSATTTVAGTVFTIDTVPAIDTVTLTVSAATSSLAGIVTATPQTFGGAKTFSALITGQAGLTVAGNIIVNNTATNTSDNAFTINPSYTGGATDLLIYNGINLTAFSPTNAAGTDTINGINLGNLTDPGATISSNGLNIGSGWDTGIKVTNGSSTRYGIDIAHNSSGSGVHIVGAAAGVSAAFNNLIELQTGTLTAPAASTTIYGINLSAGAISTSSSGIANWNGLSMTTPNITQGGGAITTTGLKVALGTITTGGTQTGLTVTPSNSNAAGTLTGINIGNITAGSATETALLVGTGWDNALQINSLNVFNGSGVLSTSASVVTGSYTGITGAGALDAGSITANFGAINVGADSITTSGTVGTAGTTTFTGGAATFTGDVALSQSAGINLQLTATAAPTVDQLAITNTGQAVTTADVNGLDIDYTGGAAAVEAAGAKVAITPGTTTGGTWSGLRIVASGTAPVTGVTEYGIKIEGNGTQGAGTETGLYIGTGWDTGLDVQSGGLNLAGYTSGGNPSDPAAAATDNLRVYAKKIAGRMMLKTKGPAGVDNPLQTALFGNNIIMFTPTSGTTVTGGFGTLWSASSGAGTVTTPAPSTTAPALSSQMHRYQKPNVVTTQNQAMGVRANATDSFQFWRGNSAGIGGFFFTTRFILVAWPAATARVFTGLSASATEVVISNTVVNDTAGLWHDTTDSSTTFNLVTRNTATTTKTVMTVANAIATGNSYDFFMYCAPNGGTIFARLDDLVNGTTVETNTTSTLPTNTAFMAPQVEASNGTANTTANTTIMGINRIYVESDY